jgi:tetratricopeptide (TPR) repeat protein
VARRLDDRVLEGQAALNLSEIERRAGDHGAAQAHAQKGLRLARGREDPEEEAEALMQIGLLEIDGGELSRAEETFRRVRQIGRLISNRLVQALCEKHLAYAAFLRGRYARASRLYRKSLALMTADTRGAHRVEALGGAIMADARRAHIDRPLLQEFVDLTQAAGWERNAADELFDAARSLLLLRRPSAAGELLALVVLMDIRLHEEDEERLPRQMLYRLMTLLTLAGETRQPACVRKLRAELQRHLLSNACDSLIDTVVEAARRRRVSGRSS